MKHSKPVFITYFIDDIDSPKRIGASVSDLISHLVTEFGENEAELRSVLSK